MMVGIVFSEINSHEGKKAPKVELVPREKARGRFPVDQIKDNFDDLNELNSDAN